VRPRGLCRNCRDASNRTHSTLSAIVWAQIDALSAVRMHVAKDLRSQEARRAAMRALAEITASRFKGAPPLLDPAEDMGIADSDFRKLQRRLEATEGLLADHPLAGASSLHSRLSALQRKQVRTGGRMTWFILRVGSSAAAAIEGEQQCDSAATHGSS